MKFEINKQSVSDTLEYKKKQNYWLKKREKTEIFCTVRSFVSEEMSRNSTPDFESFFQKSVCSSVNFI